MAAIFVVGDRDAIPALLQDLLLDEEYAVHVANGGAAAFDAFAQTVIHAIMFDIVMPDMCCTDM